MIIYLFLIYFYIFDIKKILTIEKNFQFKFCLVLWHINRCRLFNAKSLLYIYIKYIRFCFVWFYAISTIVGYLKPNTNYTYIKYI